MNLSTLHLQVVESSEDFHQGVWQKDGLLVVTPDSVFPDRCAICSREAKGRLVPKTLFWHNPLLLPLLLLSFPFYVMLAVVFRRILTVRFPMCTGHWLMRWSFTIVGASLLPSLIMMGLYGIEFGQPHLILVGILCSLFGLGMIGYGRNPVWASSIQRDRAVVRGADPEFVASFPKWSGSEL
jgi:hypothetical protein